MAFLWLLTSGGFGLCLESQWSNGHLYRFVKRPIDCGFGNNALFFFLLHDCVVYVVVDHLAFVAADWCSLQLPSFWMYCRRMHVRFYMSSWKETSSVFVSIGLPEEVTSKICLFITLQDLLKLILKYFNLSPNSSMCLVDKWMRICLNLAALNYIHRRYFPLCFFRIHTELSFPFSFLFFLKENQASVQEITSCLTSFWCHLLFLKDGKFWRGTSSRNIMPLPCRDSNIETRQSS